MTAALLACQGGWCKQRERCANYLHGLMPANEPPADRLCQQGHDGHSNWVLVMPIDRIEKEDSHVE